MRTLIVALFLVLVSCQQPLRSFERTSDDWFLLIIGLQLKESQLDRSDRMFLRYMENWITAADDERVPTASQQKWLLDIKRRLDNP